MSKAPGMYETPGALPGAGAMIRAFQKLSPAPTDRITGPIRRAGAHPGSVASFFRLPRCRSNPMGYF